MPAGTEISPAQVLQVMRELEAHQGKLLSLLNTHSNLPLPVMEALMQSSVCLVDFLKRGSQVTFPTQTAAADYCHVMASRFVNANSNQNSRYKDRQARGRQEYANTMTDLLAVISGLAYDREYWRKFCSLSLKEINALSQYGLLGLTVEMAIDQLIVDRVPQAENFATATNSF